MKKLSVLSLSSRLVVLSIVVLVSSTSRLTLKVTASSLEVCQGQSAGDSLRPLLMIDAQESDIYVRHGSAIGRPPATPVEILREPAVVRSVRVSPNSLVIASGDDEDEIQVWDIATGEELYSWPSGRSRRTSTQAVDFTPDGQTIVGGGLVPGHLRLWQWQENMGLVKVPPLDNVLSVDVSPDGEIIATGHSLGIINLWTQDLELIRSIPAYDSATIVIAVEFAPNASILASRGFAPPGTDSGVKLFDLSTGTERETLSSESSGSIGESGGDAIAYSPDGNILAGYYSDTVEAIPVRLWNPRSGETIADLPTAVEKPYAVAFSSDGEFIAIAGLDDLIEVWNVQSQEIVQTFTSGLDFHHVFSIDFVPNSRAFVTSGIAALHDPEDNPYQGTIMTWALPCEDFDREADY